MDYDAITYEEAWGPGSIPRHEFTAWADGMKVGSLIVNGDEPDWRGDQELPAWTIFNVSVHHAHRRRGVATALLTYARGTLPHVHHSPYRNAAGDAWARSDPAFEIAGSR